VATRGFIARLPGHSPDNPDRVQYTLRGSQCLKEWIDRGDQHEKVGTISMFYEMLHYYRERHELESVMGDTQTDDPAPLDAIYDMKYRIQWFYDHDTQTLFRVPFSDQVDDGIFGFQEWLDYPPKNWETFKRIQLKSSQTHEGISDEYGKDNDNDLG
jgi:hypothetical protein